MQNILKYINKVPVWSLFPGLFIYVVLRALLVDPLHDEVATYFHYIETGEIFGDMALLDANNHLLNSLWGKWMYELFGNHFFLFRLGNVLAFPVYFAACASLSKELNERWKQLLFVAALTCVPYLLDYFSCARGYGMAIGFFFGGLASFRLWLKTKNPAWQFVMYALMLLSVFSNLVCLVCACILLAYAVFMQLLRFRQFSWKQHVLQLGLHAGFMIGLLPLVDFGLILKDAGALYYGSLDGFWPVTGKSLSRYVLFYDADFLRWFYLLAGIALIVTGIIRLRKSGFLPFLTTANAILLVFLLGNICSVLYLSKVLKVNYPEDRAGMYFIPLGIAAMAFLMLQSKRLAPAGIALLFFPVTLFATLNLRTSVFSPDDRMPESFYLTVRKHFKPGLTITIDPIQHLTWSRFEQLKAGDHKWFGVQDRTAYECFDIIVTKTAFPIPPELRKQYQVIATADNGFIAYKRKPDPRIVKFTTRTILPDDYSGTDEFVLLLHDTLVHGKSFHLDRLHISGDFSIDTSYRDLHMVVCTTDSSGAFVRFDNFNLRWYFGKNRRSFHYDFPYGSRPFNEREKELKVYIWNPEHRKVRNTKSKVDWVISVKK